ncbi:MAG TPA: DUF3618 domain-containing protein [Fibrobacteria bacterium]|nr:DUF3618 domain-containing protein [Fibrobacteria bacterium]
MNKDPNPVSGKSAKASVDYGKSSPEEIMAEIEHTRAHMDETLHLLGRKLKPMVPRLAVLTAAGILGASLLTLVGWKLLKSKPHGAEAIKARVKAYAKQTRKGTTRWREARTFEQVMLASKLAMAVRKGRPAIIVVEPRKI